MNQVGRAVPRLEARTKVTGRADYVHNLRVPGMLYGKIFRSTVAHGRILSIDVADARAAEGVFAVVTGEDIKTIIPNPYYGPAFHDQPILALDKVRYVGEAVAVVLAADPHAAERAVQSIVAEYEELPPVFDEVEAVTSSAIVHDELKPAGTFADLKHLAGRKNTNVALDYQLRRGDVKRAMASADHVLEHTFKTQQCMHTPLEPIVALAEPGDGSLTIHSSCQTPSFVRMEIARLLGWPKTRDGEGAVPRWRLRRQGLCESGSPRRSTRLAGAPAGEDRAHHGRAVLHHHQTRHDVPHQKRHQQGWPRRRA
jgi:CO/xanthine dehydrogenase Mo-binding subunit